MFKRDSSYFKAINNCSGFTLLELMVVVVVMGVMVAVAVPVYEGITANAADKAHAANVRILHSSARQFIVENVDAIGEQITWSNETGDEWENYLDKWPTVPPNVDQHSDDQHPDNFEIPSGDILDPPEYKVQIKGGEVDVTFVSQ